MHFSTTTIQIIIVAALLIAIFIALGMPGAKAQTQGTQRYLALSLVNESDRHDGLDDIRNAHRLGFNAVLLTVQWGSIHGQLAEIVKQENGPDYNLWKQYDDQIALALSLEMKVGLNLHIATLDSIAQGQSDRYGEATGDGWTKADRVLCVGMDGTEAVYQKYGGLLRPPALHVQHVMTSLAAASTKTRIQTFTEEAIERYKYLQDKGKLLYVDLVWTRAQEGEFEFGTDKWDNDKPTGLDVLESFSDYSQPIVMDYRAWLTQKYGGAIGILNKKWGAHYKQFSEIQPKNPRTGAIFSGPDGHDWYRYRTHLLKETNRLFKQSVARVDSTIKVISHHGSVYDRISFLRNTFSFHEIAADLDGIKINDALIYDHRFALDLLRSNLPGKLYINEAEYAGSKADLAAMIQQVEESFDHGADVVTFFNFNSPEFSPSEAIFKRIVANYIERPKQIVPPPTNTDSFTLSSMVDTKSNVGGCHTTDRNGSARDCDAYRIWSNAYRKAGNRPVNIFIKDDLK